MSDRYIARGSAVRSPSLNAGGRRGRADQDVDLLEGGVEVVADQAADLEGLVVILVGIAGREGEGAEHDPPLDLGAEPLGPAGHHHPDQRRQVLLAGILGREILGPVAVDRAVVAGQVAGALGRGDDVIGRDAVLRVRQRDLLDRRAGRLVDPDGLVDRGCDLGVEPLAEELADDADRAAIPGACPGSPGSRASARRRSSSRSGRGPAITPSRRAASARSWANGPIWSSELANAIRP